MHGSATALDVRENLRRAFLKLMHQKPFEKIKVVDVVKAANVSRGSFYRYYSDLYDLAADCFCAYLTCAYGKKVSSYNSPEEFVECAVEFYKTRLGFCFDNPAFARLIYGSGMHLNYLSRVIKQGVAGMEESIEDVQTSRNEAARLFSPNMIARFNLHGQSSIIRDWIERGMIEPIDVVARRMAYLSFHLSDIFSATGGACAEMKQAVLEGLGQPLRKCSEQREDLPVYCDFV